MMKGIDVHGFFMSERVAQVAITALMVSTGYHVYVAYNDGLWGLLPAIGLALSTGRAVFGGHRYATYLFSGLDIAYALAYSGWLGKIVTWLFPAAPANAANPVLFAFAIGLILTFWAHTAKVKRESEMAPAILFPQVRFPSPPVRPYLVEPASGPGAGDGEPECHFAGCKQPATRCACGLAHCKTHAGPHARHYHKNGVVA